MKKGKDGKFVKSSPYGYRLTTRLYSDSDQKFLEDAERKGLTPGELGREIIHKYYSGDTKGQVAS